MNFPEKLKYTKDHEWIRVEGATGFIGITDYAQGELGDIVFVELPSAGKKVEFNVQPFTVSANNNIRHSTIPAVLGTVAITITYDTAF